MEALHDIWLCRYPRPQMVRFDNGNEFKAEFAQTCRNFGLKAKPTSMYNPQSNGIIERIHLVLGNMLGTFENINGDLLPIMPFRSFISAASWAIRSTYHTTLQATPGQLVFGRDMLLSIPFRADWAQIKIQKQGLINKGVLRDNASRIQHKYKVGDQVLLDKPGLLRKSTQPRTGPHTVTKIYQNSTVQIKQGAITERVTLRRLTLYFS
jgi:transposase InsO family protein